MKKISTYILSGIASCLFVASCDKQEDAFMVDPINDNHNIELQCLIENNYSASYSSGKIATKSLIDQTTNTDSILCNFLRLDSDGNSAWEKAYLSEGTIATVPADGYRTISLHPAQPYNTTDKNDKSKMIGWYPKTDDVPQTASGNDVTVQYENFKGTCVVMQDKTCVKFTGLDGSKDLMISNVQEGSYNEKFEPFKFRHYLSAIRVYAKSEQSSQDLGLWGEINEVVIRNQPTSCIVQLPTETPQSEELFGTVLEWGNENAKFKIQKSRIYGDNDIDYPQNLLPEEYPVKFDGSDVEKYLGYSLIKPNQPLLMQVHTGAGVYNVEVPVEYGGEQIFNPGYIYDIHLNFNTDGTIFAFIERDGSGRYFDLSAGHEYDNTDDIVYDYKNANCYIIESAPDQENLYDGFCFDATVVGNGEGGIISAGAQTFYPQNAHIEPYSAEVLWQSSPRLVSQIELIYGYVRFKVTKETPSTYKKGNAVIAVYDKEMNVLWSWHIWITDTPDDVTYKEGETSITIMDRNLGALFGTTPNNASDALASYGLYYQWGRKDPSMGPPTHDYHPINMITAPYYDYSSDRMDAAEVVRFSTPTLKDAVENPMYLVMPTSQTQTYSFNWLYEKIDFLWGYSKTTGYTHKTIYDPCPYGYRVSGGELADLFTYASTSHNAIVLNDYGQTVTLPKETGSAETVSLFFPYSGYKGVDRGLNSLISSWKYVGQKGDYQSSIVSMYTEDEEYYMHRSRIYLSKDRTWNELNVGEYTGHQIQDHTNRRTAAPVRCVKNEEHKRVMAFITPDKYTIVGTTDKVNFSLYAYSFDSQISSAILSIGYHLKDNPESHQEYVIGTWNPNILNPNSSIWNQNHEFDFTELKDTESNPLSVEQTTGEFRFILSVKSVDNINKMSSTTVRLEKNHVEFLNWVEEETMFAGTAINKIFRIFGDSRPVKVEIWQKGEGENPDILLEDVTGNLQSNLGSDYPFDYNCTTQGLQFSTEGQYQVYLKITLENGQVMNSVLRTFIINQAQWVEVTDLNDITDSGEYLIMNVSSDDFAYDNGNNVYVKAVFDDACYFAIKKSGTDYLIQNKQTGQYANVSGYSLYMNATSSSEASKFVLEYDDDGGYFKIGNQLRSYHNYYYYWRQIEGSNQVTIATGDSDIMRWKIYKKNF